MKRYISLAILCISALSTVFAAGDPVVEALEAYTYPAGRAPRYNAVFTPDGKLVSVSDDGRMIFALDPATGNPTDTLINLSRTRENSIAGFDDFIISPDGSKLLLSTETEPVYRRSNTARYYVYERRTRLLRPLSREHQRQRDPLFSPDSRMVAFVADNNIYCAKLDYQTEVAVTTDGAVGSVINGASDWTYEEEFGITAAMSWAPDNLTLAFLRWDESAVPAYTLPIYEGTCDARSQYALYPGIYSYKYPVAGQPNARVSLHCYDVETRKITDTELPDAPYYIPRIEYAPQGSRLMVIGLNRDQNRLEIFAVNPKSTVCRSVYTDESRAWIIPEAYENFTTEADAFVVASDRSGFTRYYRYSYTGTPMGEIGAEDEDATAYYGRDAAGNDYWQAASPTPMDRTIYRSDRRAGRVAIGTASGTSDAVFDPTMSFAAITYSDINTPPATSMHRADGRKLRVLQDNAEYAAAVTPLKAERRFITVQSDGLSLNGYVVSAPGTTGTCPVIMSQYSGPGSQSVLNRWSFGWEDYYATHGFMVVCVDGRGTGGRGAQFRTAVYRRLGYYETIDQLAAARHAATLPGADGNAIGIYGWSYGGYESLMAATAQGNPYKAAVAVAPVTDWRFYDTVYTERYMLTPSQNESGYNAASVLQRASRLSCPLLTMYGTSDDNVHPANTLQLVSQLQSLGILSDMYVFPNMNHSINGCNMRAVVYGRMFRFFRNELQGRSGR